jgi:hypothetical protein
MKTKRTEITIEFEEIISSAERQPMPNPVCPACGAAVPPITPEMATVLSQVTASVDQLSQSGEVQSLDISGPPLLLAANSRGQSEQSDPIENPLAHESVFSEPSELTRRDP